MKRCVNLVATVGAGLLALAGPVGADGHARVVVAFDIDAGEVAEGVAVNGDGDVYTGLSALGRMLVVPGGDGDAEELLVLDGLAEGDFGFTGHATNVYGWLYAAVVSANPELNGVLSIDPDTGSWEHVPGTEAMAMANGIGVDFDRGLFVSDTVTGAVWRVGSSWDSVGEYEVGQWVASPLLEGTGDLPFPFPVGANGVAVRDDTVYVANTEQSIIVAIPILDDGSAGEPYVHLELPGVAADGIAFDAAGNLYVADPSAHTLWEVTPDGAITAVADVDDGLSGPSSVALWEDSESGELVAYVSNQAIGPPDTIKHGPSIIAVNLG